MNSINFTVIIRTVVILCGLSLIGISMFKMPDWFRSWFIGICIVWGTIFLIDHDENKDPKP